MMRVFSAKALVLAGVACVTAGVAALVACSSSGTNGGGGGSSSGGNDGGSGTTLECANSVIPILFSPMYSAYVTDNTSGQTIAFQIPAVVNDSTVDPSTVTWGVSDTSVVSIAADPTTGGTMITVNKPGTVTVVAQVSGGCGASQLTITPATFAQWSAGNARYNNDVPLNFFCLGNPGGTTPDGGTCPDAGPACTQCHGPSADAGFGFTDIGHTPEQTGGFSDDDLISIIHGSVPGCSADAGCPTANSGYYDPSIISYRRWTQFHHWDDIQGDQAQGMVVYLRSLTPTPQNGSANFGGHYDGGHHDGGHHHDGGEGGGPPGQDSGGGPDAGGGPDSAGD
jgi:hypothetical protein